MSQKQTALLTLFLAALVLCLSLIFQPRGAKSPSSNLPIPAPYQYNGDWTALVALPKPSKWFFAPPSPPTQWNLQKGKKLFQKHCASCHGIHGDGKGAAATYLRISPANLVKGPLKFKSHLGKAPSREDLFRSITVGFPLSGMPSFGHLSPQDRWNLVAYLISRSSYLQQPKGKDLPSPPQVPSTPETLARGKALYQKLNCNTCHGIKGDGKGVIAGSLRDGQGKRIQPANFLLGYSGVKSGHTAKDIYRVILTGIPPFMPSHMPYLKQYTTKDIMSLARYVENMIFQGEEGIQKDWLAFQKEWRRRYPMEGLEKQAYPNRHDPALSRKFRQTSREKAKEKGCLACHEGIHLIQGDNGKMGEAILAMAGGEQGRTCVVCHEGNPQAYTKENAHANMFPDPGSMWVVSFAKGCGKCHVGHHGLSSLHGMSFPVKMQGPMVVNSRISDPSGKTGHSHVYRTQRSMMSTEFGKASYALQVAGFLKPREFIYADFEMADPLGEKPLVGTKAYQKWLLEALQKKEMVRIEKTRAFPPFYGMKKEWKKKKTRYLVDYYRKACGRCHLWHQGRYLKGEFRGGGCSACHVLYSREGLYEGKDPTITKKKGGHPQFHKITAKIPHTQCARCHMSLYKHENIPPDVKSLTGYGPEIHLDRGMECIDCHTSIDLHGDGNIYPSLQYQVETKCSDCHGTRQAFPWELPLGDRRKKGSPRGVFRYCETCQTHISQKGTCPNCQVRNKQAKIIEYLLTSRGNPRGNVFRKGNRVFLRRKMDGVLREVPLLKTGKLQSIRRNFPELKPYHSRTDLIQKHKRLECSACHSRQTSKCYICHLVRDDKKSSPDYLLSPPRFNPKKGTLTHYFLTKGSFNPKEVPRTKQERFWGLGHPDILPTLTGTLRPFQPVCITYAVIEKKVFGGDKPPFEKLVQKFYRLHMGKTFLGTPNAHEFTQRPRNCIECHKTNSQNQNPGEKEDEEE